MVDQSQTEIEPIHQADGESGETDPKVQKEVESVELIESVELTESVELVPNWPSLDPQILDGTRAYETKNFQE